MLAEGGAVVVDADAIVRDVQAPGSAVLAEIASEFGADVVRADGSLDRPALAARVFGHPERLAALNAIVHPAVREESQRRFRAAHADHADAVVVYDVPLLAEARGSGEWDLVVVAHAPSEQRVQRLISQRGLSEADARARIASQAGDDERLALADVVIDTTGDLDATRRQVDELWERLKRR
ncbi:Dephospho-CoA kinase [Microbacterium sp. Bi128]|nr:Dephospho-CoA kinase [Microbacterium sp. Bi128]